MTFLKFSAATAAACLLAAAASQASADVTTFTLSGSGSGTATPVDSTGAATGAAQTFQDIDLAFVVASTVPGEVDSATVSAQGQSASLDVAHWISMYYIGTTEELFTDAVGNVTAAFDSPALTDHVRPYNLPPTPVNLDAFNDFQATYSGATYDVHFTSFTSPEFSELTVASGTPEPAGWALMILGFGGVGSLLRRRTFIQTGV